MKMLQLLALPLFAACAVVHRPATTIAQLQRDGVTARIAERSTRDSVIERLVRRAVARGDKTLDVLMLSGGGQNGAFGVGFLRGWHARTDSPMPRFDLVTGISTGSLQAPYALVGTTKALDTITAIYARAAESIAPSIDWLFWLRKTGGVVNTKKFDRSLRESIGGEFRGDLVRAFADDRQLLIGTSDFDLAIGRSWSLGDTFDTTSTGLDRTAMLLKAATAIPGIFPPVVVDGHVHADGGVISNVLLLLTFEDYQQLARRLAEKGLTDVTIRVFVVMNFWSHAPPQIISPSKVKQIAARSNTMLFFSHQPQTLEDLGNLARAVSSQVRGLRVELKVATLDAQLALEPGANKLFEHAFMQQLDNIGYAKARSASPWDKLPSAYERPPIVKE